MTPPVIAVDPGPVESAWVGWDGEKVCGFGKWPNAELLASLSRPHVGSELVIEQIASYGMAVGAEVFETVFWSGRFAQAFKGEWHRVPRLKVKLQMCRDSRAKDANIRQALIDKFGGKERAIGSKKSPGPLFGIKADCWQALALAVTWTETKGMCANA